MTTAAVDTYALPAPYGPVGGRALPYAGSSASIARASVRDALEGWSGERLDDAVLLVTELVSNAVIHGQPGIELAIDVTAGRARISVTDTGLEMPKRRPVWAGGYRGLEIVEMLADSWGFDPIAAGGKTVWFELTS